MKRMISLALAGGVMVLLTVAGCSDKCRTCGLRHEEAACCDAPAAGAEVRQGAPVESRTEVARPGAATRPAR